MGLRFHVGLLLRHPFRSPRKGKIQPIWWNAKCDVAVERRRVALMNYISNQAHEEKALDHALDGKVKRLLRAQKHLSFVTFCDSIDPSMGLSKIWLEQVS